MNGKQHEGRQKKEADTNLCIFTQVDPPWDVVDGGDPLVERDNIRKQQQTQRRLHKVRVFYLLAFLPALRLQRHHSDIIKRRKWFLFWPKNYKKRGGAEHIWEENYKKGPLTFSHQRKWPESRIGGHHSQLPWRRSCQGLWPARPPPLPGPVASGFHPV